MESNFSFFSFVEMRLAARNRISRIFSYPFFHWEREHNKHRSLNDHLYSFSILVSPFFPLQEDLKEAFRVFDREGKGYLTRQELESVMKNYDEGLTEKQMLTMMQRAKFDHKDRLNMENFLKLIFNEDWRIFCPKTLMSAEKETRSSFN